mmetsp:Transcript_15682/g.34293  ORF Transcript_15682/g.34293 Transcript_15682/m.34293 type:complete len:123 (+) Transcript_15682:313-681(+)
MCHNIHVTDREDLVVQYIGNGGCLVVLQISTYLLWASITLNEWRLEQNSALAYQPIESLRLMKSRFRAYKSTMSRRKIPEFSSASSSRCLRIAPANSSRRHAIKNIRNNGGKLLRRAGFRAL